MRIFLWLLALIGLPALGAEAGQAPAGTAALPASFSGPLAPLTPATINRDGAGGVTIRAVRLRTPLRIDARLD